MHLGKYLTLAVAFAAAASTQGAKPIAPKKALAMIRAGYATATSATVTALRNTVATTGGTISMTINVNAFNNPSNTSTGGTLLLGGANTNSNTYTGTTTTSTGAIQLNNISFSSTGASTLISSANPYTGVIENLKGGLTLGTFPPSGSITTGGTLANSAITLPPLNLGTSVLTAGNSLGGTISGSLTLNSNQLTIASLGTAVNAVTSGSAALNLSTTLGTVAVANGFALNLGGGGNPLTLTSATGNITSAITVNSGTLNLATGGLNIPNLTVGQTGTATIANTSGTAYSLNLSNGTTVSLAAGGTLTITGGSPYVTGASPVALSISISNPVQVTPAN